MFLSILASRRGSPGFPARARAGQFGASAGEANFPHGLAGRSPSSVGFPFHAPRLRRATPGLLLPLKRRRPRQPSPHHRVVLAFSPVAYRRDLPTIGRWRASPVMVQDHFLQAAARITVMVRDRHSARSIPRRGFGSPSTLPPGAVFGAPSRPKCRLPKSPCLAPSSRRLLRHLPVALSWLLTSAEYRRVRAESSVRARTRTGRLRRAVILLSSPHPFFWWYT